VATRTDAGRLPGAVSCWNTHCGRSDADVWVAHARGGAPLHDPVETAHAYVQRLALRQPRPVATPLPDRRTGGPGGRQPLAQTSTGAGPRIEAALAPTTQGDSAGCMRQLDELLTASARTESSAS